MNPDHGVLDIAADAALKLAAERPWRGIALRDVAAAAGLPMTALYGVARSKDDVVDAVMARFDRAAADELDLDADASDRERVFDAAMARFDAMEKERAGAASILRDAFAEPLAPLRLWPFDARSARWLLELAGVDTAGALGLARVHGFALLLARVTRAWLKDEAGDLAQTMATLDRGLRDAEAWRARFTRAARPEPGGAEPAGSDDGSDDAPDGRSDGATSSEA